MKKIIEHLDGFRWHEDGTSSIPFEKDSDMWDKLIGEGCEVEYLSQSEKDAYQKQVERELKLSKIVELEMGQTKRLLRNAALGDQYAINKLQTIEDEVEAIRSTL